MSETAARDEQPEILFAKTNDVLVRKALLALGIQPWPSKPEERVKLLERHYRAAYEKGVASGTCTRCNGVCPDEMTCPYCGDEPEGDAVADTPPLSDVDSGEPDSSPASMGDPEVARDVQEDAPDGHAVARMTAEPAEEADDFDYSSLGPPKTAIGRLAHPAAGIFPMLEADALQELADDIVKHGMHEPIVLFEGKILDGRNRSAACELAGHPELAIYIEPEIADPVAFVLSANLHRRQLDDDGRAFVAARLATLKHGQRQSGQLAGVPTQAEAAKALNVPERRVRRAKQVLEHGSPALVAAVVAGTVAVSAAAKATRETPEKQLEIVEAARAAKPKNAGHSSESGEHYSPIALVEAARTALGGIDLDPASCELANEVVGASRIFTRKEDGLSKKWKGRAFVNPPGCRDGHDSMQAKWWEKLVHEYDAGRVTEAIFVAFNIQILQTSQGSKGKTPHDFPICFPAKRLDFRQPEGTARSHAPHASCIVYVGPHVDRFVAAFAPFGRLMGPVHAVDRIKPKTATKTPPRTTKLATTPAKKKTTRASPVKRKSRT